METHTAASHFFLGKMFYKYTPMKSHWNKLYRYAKDYTERRSRVFLAVLCFAVYFFLVHFHD